jgi:hypothetical protein
MHLVCLTPTYGRPSLVRNALALFLRQQLRPGDTAHMLILADDGLINSQQARVGPLSWEVVASSTWWPLTRKYAPMLEHARQRQPTIDAWVVWDDDDVYLPWHLAAHALALQAGPWSHPSKAYSTYEGLHERTLSGRHYHGALAIDESLLRELDGWPHTDRSDYDKQMLACCRNRAGRPSDPCLHYPPSYVYRWADTGRDHCSGRSRIDEDGVRRYQPPRIQEPACPVLTPHLDASTIDILARLTGSPQAAD